jgi:hypothetical protein
VDLPETNNKPETQFRRRAPMLDPSEHS